MLAGTPVISGCHAVDYTDFFHALRESKRVGDSDDDGDFISMSRLRDGDVMHGTNKLKRLKTPSVLENGNVLPAG
jgi:hypothetical protein